MTDTSSEGTSTRARSTEPWDNSWKVQSLDERLTITCYALIDHLVGSDRPIPDDVVELAAKLDSGTVRAEDLLQLYNSLSKAVAPALPDAIASLYIADRKWGLWGRLFPYKTVTLLLLLAVVLLISFVLLGSSSLVNEKTLDVHFIEREGAAQWAASLFLLCAAGLGASLEGLFRAYSFLVTRTYDVGYDSSYLIRLIMGVLSGFVLADLLYQLLPLGDSEIGKPITAIIGGFSAEAVQQILRRISETVQNMFRESVRDNLAKQTLQLQARMQAKQREVNEKAIADLLELKKKVTDPAGAAGIDSVVKNIVKNWGS